MSKKIPEIIFAAKAKNGELLFENEEHLRFYNIEHDEEDLLVHIEPVAKTSQKLRLYAFYYCNVLECAVIGYTNAGYSGIDIVHADYLLRASFAKNFIKKPNGEYVPIMLDKRNMTMPRLLKFVQDSIFFIESELQITVPSSEEWKIMRATGRSFKKVTNQNEI